MRAFFALEVPPELQCAIGRWRDRAALVRGARAVPAENFHITLAFLGDITPRQVDAICAGADRIAPPRLTLRLDRIGYFPRARILWIGPTDTPHDLTDLVARLRRIAQRAGVRVARKKFTPHLTLLRDCRAPMMQIDAPHFDLHCDGFALFESRMKSDGVRYHPLRSWRA